MASKKFLLDGNICGERVRLGRAMQKPPMTQEDLALRLGVSRQSISKWELGICDPDIQNLKEISKLFDVSFDYLLNDEKNEALPLKTLAEAPSAQNNSKKREEEMQKIQAEQSGD